MRTWCWLAVLLALGATAPSAAATVSFGAAVITPVAGAPFAVANLTGLAPVGGSWALTLTRSADAASARLTLAHAAGLRYRTIRLAWSAAGGTASLCLDDVAIASYARRALPGGRGAVEHLTLAYAAAHRALGVGACHGRPPPPPVVVRLDAEPAAGLRARVDCLLARCLGSLRLLCPAVGCPTPGGLPAGAFALGAGREAILHARLPPSVGGRHPTLTAAVRLAGRAAPVLLPVVVDAPAPAGLPTLTSRAPSPSTSPTPAGLDAGSPGLGPGGGSTPPGPGPGAGPPALGAGPGSPGGAAGGGGPGGAGGGGSGGGPRDTTLDLACDGPSGNFTGVHGVLGPSLEGGPIEIDYVPLDPAAPTVIHNIAAGPGGRFSDSSGALFYRAVAFYAGDDGYVGAYGFCP